MKDSELLYSEFNDCKSHLAESLSNSPNNVANFVMEMRRVNSSLQSSSSNTAAISVSVVGFVEIHVTTDNCFLIAEALKSSSNPINSSNETPFPFQEKRPRILALSVSTEYRRHGIATRLIGACISQAKLWGYDNLFLEVESDNEAGILFYERMGFRRILQKENIFIYMKNI